MSAVERRYRHGAEALLFEGLNLRRGASVLIICQSDRADLADLIELCARSGGVRVDRRDYPRQDFIGKNAEIISARALEQMHPEPVGVVLLMEHSRETTAARLRFLQLLQDMNRGWRIASMPGVTLRDMTLCRGNLVDLTRRCRSVFWALAAGRNAAIETVGPTGAADILRVWFTRHVPIMSSGAIAAGTWGNFPSGETFVLPDPGTAFGSVTLRGSIPGYALRGDEWIRFELQRGRMVISDIQASTPALLRRFRGLMLRSDGKPKVKNGTVLAELGVGINPHVRDLTGSPLFDEKVSGTVHLAFGRNLQFGGKVESPVHHDLVCTGATLRSGAVTIVAEGRLRTPASLSMSTIHPSAQMSGATMIARVLVADWRLEKTRRLRPRLQVTYTPYRGDPQTFVICRGRTASLASQLLACLEREKLISVEQALMALRPHPDGAQGWLNILGLLARHGLVEVGSDGIC